MSSLLASFALTLNLLLAGGCSEKESLPTDPGTGSFVRYTSGIGMPSKILKQSVNVAVLLPDDYLSAPDKRYGVVYLLHGFGDQHTAWNDQWLRIEQLVKQLEEQGMERMIYIMPTGFSSYYVNRHNGNFDYMNMFANELVPYVDRTYRTQADRTHRAVVGYSMGGFGAMILPSKHPELFSVSVPLSMSFRTDEQYMTESASGWDSQWGAIFGGAGSTGEARLTPYYKAHCPYYMFTDTGKDTYADVAYYFDCGDDEEQLLVANDDLHRQLRDVGMDAEYRVRNGGHTSDYWRSAMPEVLRFIECRFNGRPFTPLPPKAHTPHTAIKQMLTLAGLSAEVFTPTGYDVSKSYPAVYLLHDGNLAMSSDEVMNSLSDLQSAKPFVLVSCNTAASPSTTLDALVSAAEEALALKTGAAYRTAIAYGNAGHAAYAATLGDPRFCALFLIDAALPAPLPAPSSNVFYFPAYSDQGSNYASGNALYKSCHANGIDYQYRVTDGKAGDKDSAARSFDEILSQLGSKIDIR